MNLSGVCLSLIAGIVPLLWLPIIPHRMFIGMLLVLALCLLAGKSLLLRYSALFMMSLCWGLLAARQSIEPFTTLTNRPVSAEVVITRTDGARNHELQIIRIANRLLFPPTGVVLKGVSLRDAVCAGQHWQMTLRLRPVHAQLNVGGFDSQRYALAQHLPLRGRVTQASRLTASCSQRASWMKSVMAGTHGLKEQGIILALAFGERSGISTEVKELLKRTGTAHLVAISGLHISLAAGIGWLLVRCMQFFMPVHRIDYRMPLMASLLTAITYTWLAGGNPPAIRAMTGLIIWLALKLSGRQWSSWQVWLCCVTGIVVYDPLAVLSESFWLSILAVACLIFWYQWMPLPRKMAGWQRGYRYLAGLLHLQLGITLLLLPLQVFIFHGISVNALLANLLAVPFISFIVVPLLLCGLVVTHIPGLAEALWRMVDTLVTRLFLVLDTIPGGWLELDYRYQLLSLAGWLAIIIYRLRLWQGSVASVLVLMVTLCLASTRVLHKKDPAFWQVTMLDVGHGLAVAIVREGKVILYDTGNAWPGGDAARQTIIPWLRWNNLTPEGVILSHEHLDHRGGLNSLQKEWPHLTIRSALRWDRHLPCVRGEQWRWQGLHFTVHWPPRNSHYQGNNGSCVVMVSDGHFRVLLTGDVEAPAELAMLKKRWEELAADIIQVPHHGSKTSSGGPLLRAVAGKAALASSSRYNAWRLPSQKIIDRYKKNAYEWYDTAHSGQITIRINRDKWQIIGFREQIMPRWYHQWFGVSPDNR